MVIDRSYTGHVLENKSSIAYIQTMVIQVGVLEGEGEQDSSPPLRKDSTVLQPGVLPALPVEEAAKAIEKNAEERSRVAAAEAARNLSSGDKLIAALDENSRKLSRFGVPKETTQR